MSKPTPEQMERFHDLQRSGIINRTNFQQYLDNPNRFVGIGSIAVSEFQRLLADCRQDWVDGNFVEDHFPLKDDSTKGEIQEHCFKRAITGFAAGKELLRLGFKFIGIRRAMEYIANGRPGVQFEHPVVVLGAEWRYADATYYVPVFHRAIYGNSVALQRVTRKFNNACRFLVSRE